MEKLNQIKRPFILSVTSIIALTYHLVFLSIFLIGILFNKFISLSLENYYPEGVSHSEILYFSVFGAVLYIISVTSLIYIRKMKRLGLILFSASTLVYFITKLIIWDISLINLIINIVFMTIFLIFIKHFY